MTRTEPGSQIRTRLDPGSFDADVHLRGRADEILVLAEVQEQRVRRGVALAKPAEDGRRVRRARLAEGLAQHDLEQIAPLECVARLLDAGGVFAGNVVRSLSDVVTGDEGNVRAVAGKRFRRGFLEVEVVRKAHRALFSMVDDDQFVRQIEDEVSLLGRALELRGQRLELKREVVAERAVEPEVNVVGTPKHVDDRAEHGKDAGLLATLFFGCAHGARADDGRERVHCGGRLLDRVQRLDRGPNRLEEHAAARVQRGHRDPTSARRERERRIDEPQVPPRVAPRVIVARRQEHAAPMVERVDQVFDGGSAVDLLRAPIDDDAASRRVPFVGGSRVDDFFHSCLLQVESPSRARQREQNERAAS
jgi:hypothetical protein